MANSRVKTDCFLLWISVWCFSLNLIAVSSKPETDSGSQYFVYQQSDYPKDCYEVEAQCMSNNASGVYMIRPDGYREPFEIYCDISTNSKGWTVIARREDGSIDFARDWISYKSGFGFLYREFWLGNEKISFLTNQKKYQLAIEMTLSNGSAIRASYDNFIVSDEFSDFKLATLGRFNGNTDAVSWCPGNMITGNRNTSCLRTCQSPDVCQAVADGCVCPNGFFAEGSVCLPEERCGCYASEAQKIIQEGGFYVNSQCQRKGVCNNGRIIWDDTYRCDSNASCDERDGIQQCYCNDDYMGDGQNCSIIPLDCQEVYDDGSTESGIYKIKPTDWPGSAFDVYCNMTDGGGWTVFQRRQDGSVDFFLLWDSYKTGFGNLSTEFWLGNDKLHYLTKQKSYEIRIDLVSREYNSYFGKFDFFRINDENDNYRLSGLGTYSGTVDERSNPNGRFLRIHYNYEFSTRDRDNDASNDNCADTYRAGWWYRNCYASNLNGDYHAYLKSPASIRCFDIPGPDHHIKYSQMMLRPN